MLLMDTKIQKVGGNISVFLPAIMFWKYLVCRTYTTLRFESLLSVSSSYLAEMDHRIEIFIFKLVFIEHFTFFGRPGGKLHRFENLVFPVYSTGTHDCGEN